MSEILYLDREQKQTFASAPWWLLRVWRGDFAAFQHIKTQSAVREDAEHAAVWFKVFKVWCSKLRFNPVSSSPVETWTRHYATVHVRHSAVLSLRQNTYFSHFSMNYSASCQSCGWLIVSGTELVRRGISNSILFLKKPPHAACFGLSFIRIKYASVRGKTAERVPARQFVSQEDARNTFSTTPRNSGFQNCWNQTTKITLCRQLRSVLL